MKVRFHKDNLLNSVRNKIIQEEMSLLMKRDFVQLNDPGKILEKGFTLTLDKNDKPVTSLKKFRSVDIKKLRFFDGETYIEERRKDD